MPESLKSFLTTHPFKRLDSLQHVCKSLKLPTAGTVDALRARIITHVDDGKVPDEEVREIAMVFKENEEIRKVKEQKNSQKSTSPEKPRGAMGPLSHSTPAPASQPLFFAAGRGRQKRIMCARRGYR